MVCDKVVCERWWVTKWCVKCERWCVTKMAGEAEAGYRIQNKNPTQRFGETKDIEPTPEPRTPKIRIGVGGFSNVHRFFIVYPLVNIQKSIENGHL